MKQGITAVEPCVEEPCIHEIVSIKLLCNFTYLETLILGCLVNCLLHPMSPSPSEWLCSCCFQSPFLHCLLFWWLCHTGQLAQGWWKHMYLNGSILEYLFFSQGFLLSKPNIGTAMIRGSVVAEFNIQMAGKLIFINKLPSPQVLFLLVIMRKLDPTEFFLLLFFSGWKMKMSSSAAACRRHMHYCSRKRRSGRIRNRTSWQKSARHSWRNSMLNNNLVSCTIGTTATL